MSSTIIFFFFIPFLSLVLLAINIIFASHNPYIEKNSPFECGYTSFIGQNRIQFSISFFIFALLFLLFDLEILLVYPYLVSAYINEMYGFLVLMTFLVILTIGFVFELGKKALTIDSRQNMPSNKNLMKKSLYTTPNTAFPLSSSIAIKGFLYLFKPYGRLLHTKSLNFNNSFYINKKSNLSITKNKSYLTKNLIINDNQLDFSKLTLVHSSLFNIKYLSSKSFLYTYLKGLKNKFTYKWVISILLTIIFTYFFRNMLISYIVLLELDLNSITAIAVLISSASVFFKIILHFIELVISGNVDKITMVPNELVVNGDVDKMTMGPNYDIETPKHYTGLNVMLKKDHTDSINSINENDSNNSNNNSNTNDMQNEPVTDNMQNQPVTDNVQNRTKTKKRFIETFQSLPLEIQLMIADSATYNEEKLNSKVKEFSDHCKALKAVVDNDPQVKLYRKPNYQNDDIRSWQYKLPFTKLDGENYVTEEHMIKYDKCIDTMEEIIISQSYRDVLFPNNPMSVYDKTEKNIQFIKLYEKVLGDCEIGRDSWRESKTYKHVYKLHSTGKVMRELGQYGETFPRIKNKEIK